MDGDLGGVLLPVRSGHGIDGVDGGGRGSGLEGQHVAGDGQQALGGIHAWTSTGLSRSLAPLVGHGRTFNDAGALLSEPVFISRSSGTWVWKTAQSIQDGFDIAVGATTGTKIGTASTQKLSFYGLTPVVQQVVCGPRGSASASASLSAKLANLGLISDTTVSPVSTKTASYKITSNDRYFIANNGTLTMTLPDPTFASVGYPVTIKNINASSCTAALMFLMVD
ncbi:hypothetical protein GU243_10900 [Pseudarthrobacter psychrotolerans]|uniref:Uncharacterized protein n=1 Tax=Pseudarthrobacter psychrotolerans TaxID=2697569 RepID=A0A6P1NN05_9MICC|nr:hypothetical protein [Pseudarthrobacter psychrotolerans]QHK20157.1 hypothetical protein GU243_10900 [Pseudarthrobacter psychrotolerans]